MNLSLPTNSLIDSHCHLDFDSLHDSIPEILTEMTTHQIIRALCIGVNLEDIDQVIALAKQHEPLYASVGVHPDYENCAEPEVESLCRLAASHDKIIAIGETGLDYYRQTTSVQQERQQQRFRTQIRAARELKKPLVVHTREAGEDTLRILKEEKGDEVGGIIHCFTETSTFAQTALDMSFYISFSGILTFPKGDNVRQVAKWLPKERLLVETDAPFLAPVPYRGKRNEPAYVRFTAECLAKIRDQSLSDIAQQTSDNFFTLFPSTQATVK